MNLAANNLLEYLLFPVNILFFPYYAFWNLSEKGHFYHKWERFNNYNLAFKSIAGQFSCSWDINAIH